MGIFYIRGCKIQREDLLRKIAHNNRRRFDMKDISTKTKSWINLIAFLVTIAVNGLGASGFINGMSQKDISNKYHTLITPAPFTFSIWGLIYSLVLVTLIMMIVKEKDTDVKKLINIFTPVFLLTSLFNILWIVTFSYEKIGISTILIFALLISLTTINERLFEHRDEVPYKLTGLSFGLYAGWLTIATVVNISAFLVSIDWNGFGIADTVWAVIILLIALIIVILISMKLKNAVYPLPVAWAFFGILKESERLAGDINYGPYIKPVTIIGIVVILIVAIMQFKANNYSILKKEID